MNRTFLGLTMCCAGVVQLAGCSVDVRDRSNDHKSVDIRTPFANVSVRTNDSAGSTGLPVYPGARPMSDDNDPHSAYVTVGNSLFGVKVIAEKFESDDAPERIAEFYERELAAYGAVTECRGDLDFEHRLATRCREKPSSREIQLGVGTPSLHRVVAVKPTATGSKISTVYIETHD